MTVVCSKLKTCFYAVHRNWCNISKKENVGAEGPGRNPCTYTIITVVRLVPKRYVVENSKGFCGQVGSCNRKKGGKWVKSINNKRDVLIIRNNSGKCL